MMPQVSNVTPFYELTAIYVNRLHECEIDKITLNSKQSCILRALHILSQNGNGSYWLCSDFNPPSAADFNVEKIFWFFILFQFLFYLIRNLTNGKTYCGQLSTRKSAWGVNGYGADKHDWSLTTACDSLNAVVCEAPLSKKEEKRKPWVKIFQSSESFGFPTDKCPYGWRMLDDQCYQFNLGDDNLRTWQAARADCQKQNADLVVIKG
jgi:hypothetical protein